MSIASASAADARTSQAARPPRQYRTAANAPSVAAASPGVSAMATMLDCHSWPASPATRPARSATRASDDGLSSRARSATSGGTAAPAARATTWGSRSHGPTIIETKPTISG